MIGGVAVREAPDSMFQMMPGNESNISTAIVDVVARDTKRVQVAVVLTTLVGIIQVSGGKKITKTFSFSSPTETLLFG